MTSPKDLSQEEIRAQAIFEGVVAKYYTRNLIALITMAFSIGVWATKMQTNQSSTTEKLSDLKIDYTERVKEWTSWRTSANARIDQTKWIVDSHEVRVTELEKKP